MLKPLAALLGLISCLLPMSASAHEYQVGAIKIGHPWMRLPPAAAKVAGGYMTLNNTGTEPDRLVGGSLVTAGRFEVHEMAVTDGVMRMKQLPQGVEIKPGETVALKPGSLHVMFFDLKAAPVADQKIKGTLIFAKAGQIEVEFKVEVPGKGSGSTSGAAHVH